MGSIKELTKRNANLMRNTAIEQVIVIDRRKIPLRGPSLPEPIRLGEKKSSKSPESRYAAVKPASTYHWQMMMASGISGSWPSISPTAKLRPLGTWMLPWKLLFVLLQSSKAGSGSL